MKMECPVLFETHEYCCLFDLDLPSRKLQNCKRANKYLVTLITVSTTPSPWVFTTVLHYRCLEIVMRLFADDC